MSTRTFFSMSVLTWQFIIKLTVKNTRKVRMRKDVDNMAIFRSNVTREEVKEF